MMRNLRDRILAAVLCVALWPQGVSALTLSEDFSGVSGKESGDLVLNLYEGALHPPLSVSGWSMSGELNADKEFDVGDGHDGDFTSTRYSHFSENGDISGNIIRFNTDTWGELEVTNFVLDAGWEIEVQGSNPFVVRSQQDVLIDGRIDCGGEDGSAVSASDQVNSGGSGRCGGGDGGDGGSSTQSATSGESTGQGFTVTGGTSGGSVAASGVGGGGGGSYYSGSFSAAGGDSNSVGAGDGGPGGSSDGDEGFTEHFGGAGGGGGSAASNDASSGGGAGAGGGLIMIFAKRDVRVSVSGEVIADGGAGGGDAGILQAGGGGGGGGGGILLFAGRDYWNDGTVSAKGGTKGETNIDGTNGGSDGGAGAIGRAWYTDNDATPEGSPNYETSVSLSNNVGMAEFETGPLEALSTALDFQNTEPTLTGVTLSSYLPSGSTLQVDMATGMDVDFDPTSLWMDVNSYVGLSLNRFLRFKITLDNQDATDPAYLSLVELSANGRRLDNFKFVGACGSTGSKPPWSLLILLPLLLVVALKLKSQKQAQLALKARGAFCGRET